MLSEGLVLGQMATKLCYHKQAVISSIKAGSKNFPDTKKYWWGYARCMEKTMGATEDTLPPQENLSGSLNYFSLSFIVVLLPANPI